MALRNQWFYAEIPKSLSVSFGPRRVTIEKNGYIYIYMNVVIGRLLVMTEKRPNLIYTIYTQGSAYRNPFGVDAF